MKRNRLSNNFRKHLVTSSRFWVGKRRISIHKPMFKYSKQNGLAKNIQLWGKRDWNGGLDYDNPYAMSFDQ